MRIINILQKIIKESSDPNNADSYPSHDEWTMKDWQTYYNALVKKWGKGKENDAKKQFLRYWEPIYQSWLDEPAEDELDDESTGFKMWFKQKEMWNGPENRPYLQKEFEDVLRYKEKYDNNQTNQTNRYATKCSSKVIEYIKKQEGFKPEPYKDTKGIWTIGYGQIMINGRPVKPGDKISEPEAAEKVNNYINDTVEPEILSYGGGHDKLSQIQFDALCSLKYNFGGYGASNLKKAIDKNPNPKKNPSIEKHFTSGWKDNELTDRRKKEFALYSSGDYVPYNYNA